MYSAHSLSYCLSFALLLSNVALPRSRSLTYQITECLCLCKCEHLFGLHTRKHHSSLVHCLHFFARISVCACPCEHIYIFVVAGCLFKTSCAGVILLFINYMLTTFVASIRAFFDFISYFSSLL